MNLVTLAALTTIILGAFTVQNFAMGYTIWTLCAEKEENAYELTVDLMVTMASHRLNTKIFGILAFASLMGTILIGLWSRLS